MTFVRVDIIFLSFKILCFTAVFLEADLFSATVTISTETFLEVGVTFVGVNAMFLSFEILFSTAAFLVAGVFSIIVTISSAAFVEVSVDMIFL